MTKLCDQGKVEEASLVLQGEMNVKFGAPMAKAVQDYVEIQRQELLNATAAGAR